MFLNAPCKQCRLEQPERHYLGCHDHCEAYKEYKEKNAEISAMRNKDFEIVWTDSHDRRKAKWSKRRNGR